MIRPFTAADLPSLVVLCEEHAAFEVAAGAAGAEGAAGTEGALPTSFRPERLQQMLLDEASPLQCLVAERAGRVVGYATFVEQWSTWHAGRYLYLDCLYLQQDVRGQGLGQLLMTETARQARQRGCLHLEWQTPTDNQAAIAFYQRLGATSNGRQRFTWRPETAAWAGAEVRSPDAEHTAEHTIATATSGILPPPASLADPYRDRPTRCTQQATWDGGTLKVYEITPDGRPLSPASITAALQCVQTYARWPEEAAHRCGFLTLNLGEQALWALLQVWASDILRQFGFYATLAQQDIFHPVPMPGFNACVWELEVTKFERDAWVRHVMTDPTAPRYDDYLNDTLTISATTR